MRPKPPGTLVPAFLAALILVLCLGQTHVPTSAFATQEASGAREAFDPFANDGAFSAILYNNANGLPTSEANAIAETSEGFIWIGSYSGLIRYDGNNFERVDSTTGVASVVSLFVDSHDRLWVGTNDSGVAVMEKGTFQFFSKADGLGSASVRAIAEDSEGSIYAATTKGITVINANRELRPLNDPRISNAYVSTLRGGAGGLLYGITRDGAVFIIDKGRVIAFYSPEDLGVTDVISLLPDPNNPGLVYLGTKASEVYHSTLTGSGTPELFDVSPLSYIKSVELYGDQLWITADNGVGVLHDGGVRALEGIPLDDSIDHSMVDYEGNLWFTSSRQGVMKVVPNQFADLYDRYDLPASVVNTTCLHNDLLYLGSDDGLTIIDENGRTASAPLSFARTASGTDLEATDLVSMLEGVRIRSIVHDDEGRLWLSTYGPYGLIRYDDQGALCFTVDDGMPSDRMRTAIQRADGSMAVACTGGAAIIEGDTVRRVYNEDDGIENIETLTVAETGSGDLVLGSDGDGIYIVGKDGTTHLGVEDGLSSDVVMRVKRDVSRDLIWIVTSNSLAYMDADYHLTTVRAFPYPNNFDLYENSQGEVWVLASNGIYVTTAEELLANDDINPVYYGRDNGLPCIATANSYSELTKDGNLYLAGTTGVARVNIEVPFEDVKNVKMAVPFVEADDVFLYPDASGVITVPASTSRLTVYPFVYTYSLMNPQISYSLQGFEQDVATTRASTLDPVDYTNLHGGTYHFVMQLQDAMGHGSQDLSVTIKKELSLTEQLWFRLCALAVVVALLWLAVQAGVRHRTARLVKKQEEDRTYIREMSEAFAHVIDMKDAYTSGHSARVAKYTRKLTRELGYDEDTVERYYNIALLHDIGKIGVPAEVLNKPGRLTDEEFETIKSHTTLGYKALAGISIMPEIAVGAWAHHERPDGKGYPQGLKEGEIPRVAQIIAVADTFDAMYSDRPYRKRMNFDKVVSIIREVRGTQLTEDVVDAFLRLVDKGEFRAPDDLGGGTTEDIDNIRKGYEEA